MPLRIGELLLQTGIISADQLQRALVEQRSSGSRLGVCLVRLGFVDEDTLALALSKQLRIPLVPPGALETIAPEVIARVPRAVAVKHNLVPIGVHGKEVHVCLADPQNLTRLDDIAFALGGAVRPFLATELLLERALTRYYPADAPASTLAPPPPGPASTGNDLWQETEWTPESRRAAQRPTPSPQPALPSPPSPEQAAAPSPDEPIAIVEPLELDEWVGGRAAAPTAEMPSWPAPEPVAARPPAAPPPPRPNEPPSGRQQRAMADLARALAAHDWSQTGGAPAAPPSSPRPTPPPTPAITLAPAALAASAVPFPPSPSVAAPMPPGLAAAGDPFVALTAVTSRQDLGAALCGFLGEVFPSFCVLDTEEKPFRCVGLRVGGVAMPEPPPGAEDSESRWLTELAGRQGIEWLPHVYDPQLAGLLQRMALPSTGITLVPIGDNGSLSHVVIGQGLDDAQLRAAAGKLRPYLLSASDALRILALRALILRRRRGEFDAPEATRSRESPLARVEPRQIPWLQAEARPRRPVRHLDFSTRAK